MNKPVAQEIYRHFKGNMYRIVTLAEHTESGEELVIYQALYGEGKIYARPVEMFMSPVDRVKYPEATQSMRFEKVEDSAGVSNSAEHIQPGVNQAQTVAIAVSEEKPEIDPKLEEFLMADTYEERLEILVTLRSRITDDMLTTMSVACDIPLTEGSIDEKYETFKKALLVLEKFECTRLR